MATAGDIMNSQVITIDPETDIHVVINLMVKHNITGLPVVDDQRRVIGVISERDVLRLLYDFEDAGGRVKDFMTAQVRCFSKDTPIQDICLCFKEHAFRRVPILENGQLVGIISRKDLIRFIREKYREQSP